MPPLAAGDVDELLAGSLTGFEQMPSADRGRHGQVGPGAGRRRCSYASAIGEMMTQMGRGADPISALAALLSPDGALNHACRFCYELRLPRARLRRAEGHPRDSGCRGAADADRDLDPPEAHARVHQGLLVVARGRGPGDVAAEALQLRRPAAAGLGAAALPPDAAHDRGSGARGAVIRIRATAPERCRRRRPRT